MEIINGVSQVDQLTPGQLEYLRRRFGDRDKPFVERVYLPEPIRPMKCICHADPIDVREVTVVTVRHESLPCVLSEVVPVLCEGK